MLSFSPAKSNAAISLNSLDIHAATTIDPHLLNCVLASDLSTKNDRPANEEAPRDLVQPQLVQADDASMRSDCAIHEWQDAISSLKKVRQIRAFHVFDRYLMT